jgi:hypothetical protein
VSGLLNWMGVGRSLVLPSGHSGWYGTLSNPGAPPELTVVPLLAQPPAQSIAVPVKFVGQP